MTQTNNPTEPFDLSFFDDTPPDHFGPSLPSYPTFQWVNGSQQRKSEGGVSYHGGWFLPEVIQPVGKLLRDPASRIIRGQRGPKHPGAPLRSFWVTVGYKRANGNGLPAFEKAGKEGNSKLITPPSAWDLPARAPKSWEEMLPFFVGQENLVLFSTWYEEALDWIKAWDAESPAPAQAQAGEWGEDGEIPF